ncbi:MAG: tetratricopeptide repeat protein [Anaerolineales bacterium]|nr:tetratricopeptide repeat protein [Anaerolineales bacterium]
MLFESPEQGNKDQVKRPGFPAQPTPFIGRIDEVGEITRLLSQPTCRLLTLVGFGGVGKTRLAIQAARQKRGDFAHGVNFVPLQPVRSANFLVSTIAEALHLTLAGSAEPAEQLGNYLRNHESLLLLDNFEQFLPQKGPELLAYLLSRAPQLKLLVTSRASLNLQEEWLYAVRGLSFPPNGQSEKLESYDAVQLFVERARRVQRDFSLSEEQAGVRRICQLVEGMPLALEIAASWTKTLRCEVIAAEMEQNLDFLRTGLRNVPERHRQMQAVFEQSWKLLSPAEQALFKRLSVFAGDFPVEAARQVAGATLPLLSALVDTCLVRRVANGRYQIHELLRQYATEKLQESPEEVAQIREQHCAYWVRFLHQQDVAMNGRLQLVATAEIAEELEDIRAAWQWAAAQTKVPALGQAADALYLFYQFRSRYREGVEMFETAVHALERAETAKPTSQVLAEILVHEGWLCIRLGQLKKARTLLEQSAALYAALEVPPPPKGMATDPLIPLGLLATLQGMCDEALQFGKAAQEQAEAQNDPGNLMFAAYVLTSALLAQGRYEAARQTAQQAYRLASSLENRWFMAYCLIDMGSVARALGNYPEAEQHYWAGYSIKQEFNDPEGLAMALTHIGHVALLQQHYREAQNVFRQSLAIYREIGDRGGLAASLEGVGLAAGFLHEDEAAQGYFARALQVAHQLHLVPLTLSILTSAGEWWRRAGQPQRGAELLALVQHHPRADQITRDRAAAGLAATQDELTAVQFSAVQRRAAENTGSLETVIAALQVEWGVSARDDSPRIKDAAEAMPEMLVEPLTQREQEVVRLIADGLSNQEIAAELVIAVGTVKAHASHIYRKLGVKNRAQTAVRAVELGLF